MSWCLICGSIPNERDRLDSLFFRGSARLYCGGVIRARITLKPFQTIASLATHPHPLNEKISGSSVLLVYGALRPALERLRVDRPPPVLAGVAAEKCCQGGCRNAFVHAAIHRHATVAGTHPADALPTLPCQAVGSTLPAPTLGFTSSLSSGRTGPVRWRRTRQGLRVRRHAAADPLSLAAGCVAAPPRATRIYAVSLTPTAAIQGSKDQPIEYSKGRWNVHSKSLKSPNTPRPREAGCGCG